MWSLTAMLWLLAPGLEAALQRHSLQKQGPRCVLLTRQAALFGLAAHHGEVHAISGLAAH